MNNSCPKCGGTHYNENNVCVRCGSFINQLPEGMILMNRYKVIEAIKAGGMGAVYKVLDTFSNQTRALKQMFFYEGNSEIQKYIIKRFIEEANLLVDLNHRSIPKVIDYFHDQNQSYYMVMDFIDGHDLYTYVIERGEGLPEKVVLKWALEICNVLTYLHSQAQPIIHRDLNPTNLILRSKDQQLMLVDFGFARPVNPDSQEMKTSVGTEVYAAPEQCAGYPEPRSDIYSLGATMYFLLTMEQSRLSSFSSIKKLRPDISPETGAIIAKALEFSPKDRFISAKEMTEVISNLMALKGFLPPSQEKKEPVKAKKSIDKLLDRIQTFEREKTKTSVKQKEEQNVSTSFKKTEEKTSKTLEKSQSSPTVYRRDKHLKKSESDKVMGHILSSIDKSYKEEKSSNTGEFTEEKKNTKFATRDLSGSRPQILKDRDAQKARDANEKKTILGKIKGWFGMGN